MSLLVHALAALAVIVSGWARPAGSLPDCRARLEGLYLTTTVAFLDGYTAEARWRVRGQRTRDRSGALLAVEANLEIELLTERDRDGAWQITRHLKTLAPLLLQAETDAGIARQAGEAWCGLIADIRNESGTVPARFRRPGNPA